ncbi:MAG: transposase [Sphingobacteriales bacterium]|nr:transposase [Sphingobacteriales bacterium]
MDDKFQNKYRISSARLQNWDYASEGAYFITICTKDRLHYFGEIENGKMILSNVGVIADLMWYEIKNHAKNIELGEFMVMPNHVHGILILNYGDTNGNTNGDMNGDTNGDTGYTNGDTNDDTNVETRHALSQQSEQSEKTIGQQRFQNQGKNTISSIVGSYKSAVTKHCNRLGFEFGWQPRFHDHIIRDAQSFDNIQNYIANNPMNWDKDKFYGNE